MYRFRVSRKSNVSRGSLTVFGRVCGGLSLPFRVPFWSFASFFRFENIVKISKSIKFDERNARRWTEEFDGLNVGLFDKSLYNYVAFFTNLYKGAVWYFISVAWDLHRLILLFCSRDELKFPKSMPHKIPSEWVYQIFMNFLTYGIDVGLSIWLFFSTCKVYRKR